jgi:hypothetical protein
MSLYNTLVTKFLSTYYNVQNPCVIFDIDGTIIIDGIFAPKNYNELISGVYEFLMYLQSIHIPVFIVTARPDYEYNRMKTSEMLQNIGIDYEYLYMWDQHSFDSHDDFKSNARKDIYLNNYNCIMSLGDNTWDYGKYGGIGVHIFDNGKYHKFIN